MKNPKLLKLLLCWWFGHDPEFKLGELIVCDRCQKELSYGQMVEGGGIYPAILQFFFRIKLFFSRCDECGRRFNRHTDKYHLPF